MANIEPFQGFLPAPNFANKISSPPYDVINSDEARLMAQNNPYSFLRIIKPEIDFKRGKAPSKRNSQNILKSY